VGLNSVGALSGQAGNALSRGTTPMADCGGHLGGVFFGRRPLNRLSLGGMDSRADTCEREDRFSLNAGPTRLRQ